MKAQISTEYVFVYVFALGIILSAIATFSYLNLSNVDAQVPETCTFALGIECQDHIIYSDGTVALQIKNVKEEIYDPYLDCTYHNGRNTTGAVIPGKIDVGQVLNISCGPYANSDLKSGDKTRIKGSINYHKNVTTFKNYRLIEGNIVGKVQ